MKIEFVEPYGVISEFVSTELPDFSVLIGPNGAGKSHVFQALLQGALKISGVLKEEIGYYDIHSFSPHPITQANRQTSELARGLTDAYFLSKSSNRTLSDISLTIYHEFVDIVGLVNGEGAKLIESDLRSEIQSLSRQGVFGLDRGDAYSSTFIQKVLLPLKDRELEQRRINSSRNPRDISINESQYCRLLSAAMRKANKLPHELTQNDVSEALHYDEDMLSNRLSEVFASYKTAQYVWAHRQVEEGRVNTYPELIQQYEKDNRPPWRVMREVLADMREAAGDYALFDFDFTDPEDLELTMENFDFFTFKTEMTNRTTDAMYEPTSLSSGEKILMALCLVSFNQNAGRRPPQLLLLDEIDAMLHPSMVKALTRTLKTLFVSQSIPVLMTSHSPMSVATLDNEEVFRVSRTGYRVEISPVTKADAISELSEGLATVDMGLRIAAYGESKITILTEGNNTKHLRRWAELFYPDDVRVFEGLEKHTNDSQLFSYGKMLSKMNLNTHFVIVWDCDAEKYAVNLQKELPEKASVTPFAFSKRKNSIVDRGIENNYDEKILEPYSTTTRANDGTVISRGFRSNCKTEFADYISENGTSEHFVHYEALKEVIGNLLHASQTP